MALDFRFVDLVESNAHFRITFRNSPVASPATALGSSASTSIQFKNARAGTARRFRIFLNDTIQATASTVIKDSTLNLEAGKNYTVILMGSARAAATAANGMRLAVIDESNIADPTTQAGIRVINATSTAIDARHYLTTGTVPATATWAAVPAYSVSSVVNVATGQYRYNVQPAGGGSALFTDALALVGTAATADIEPLPGTTVAGSVVTGIVFPGSVSGSTAAQFPTTTGSARQMVMANGTTIAATAVGYTRTDGGSFVTDGFLIGHSILAAGFTIAANNGTSTITGVSPTDLVISKATPTQLEAAAAARTLEVRNVRSFTEFGRLTVTKTGGSAGRGRRLAHGSHDAAASGHLVHVGSSSAAGVRTAVLMRRGI